MCQNLRGSHPIIQYIQIKGVRQGCNLSPTLFNLFINDLAKELDNPDCAPPTLQNLFVSCLLYTDDVVIFSDTEKGLQSALDKLNMFCTNWKLQVNLKKTKVVIFNKTGRLFKDVSFFFGSEIIEITSSYCYLGLTLSSSGSFTPAIKQLSQKARRRYKKLPVQERICKQCTTKAVENEIHFICECPQFDTERKTLFERVTEITPTFSLLKTPQKILFLLRSSNQSIIEYMGHFIFNCLQRRSQTP